jgi:arylsulfatase
MMKTKILLAGWTLVALTCVAQRPNILVFVSDDQGVGEVEALGHPFLKTPNMDRLYREGVRLADFHVTPMCTPTRGALMTGLDPLRNRATFVAGQRMGIDRDLPTIADLFATAGYRTGLFGKWHLGDAFPYRSMDRGFQQTVTFPGAHVGSMSDYWLNDYFDDHYRVNGVPKPFNGYVQDVLCDQTVQFMETSRQAGKPFLAVHCTPLPHMPYYATVEKRARFEQMKNLNMNSDQVGHFAMLEQVDEGVGRLLDWLDQSGVSDNTIVVYISDNGGTVGVPFYNAGMKGTKMTYWEGGHHVPCFIRWPKGGLTGGVAVNGLTSVTDLLPTLLGLAEVPFRPEQFDGMSLAENLRTVSPVDPNRSLVIVIGSFNTQPMGKERKEEGCVLSGSWRLVGPSLRKESGFDELYNLADDPGQCSNVIHQYPEIEQRLREIYRQWWEKKQPYFDQWERYGVGDPRCPVQELSLQEAADVNRCHQKDVREGVRNPGVWKLRAARAGTYRFRLRRYPKETNLPINAAAPEYKAFDHKDDSRCADEFQAGRGLMANRVQFSIGEKLYIAEVPSGAAFVDVEVPLAEGEFDVSGALFMNPMGKPASAVFYLEIEKLEK